MVAGQLLSSGSVRVYVCMFAPGGERPWKGSLAKTSSCRAGSLIGLIKIQLRSNYFGKQWLRKFWLSPTSWCEMQKKTQVSPFRNWPFSVNKWNAFSWRCSEWLIYTLCWLVSDYIHCRLAQECEIKAAYLVAVGCKFLSAYFEDMYRITRILGRNK